MEKVRLSQSFATTGAAAEHRGTVRGDGSCDCWSGACGGAESFLATNCQ